MKTCGFQGISWPRPTHLPTKGPVLCPRLGVCLVLREGIMNEEAEAALRSAGSTKWQGCGSQQATRVPCCVAQDLEKES